MENNQTARSRERVTRRIFILEKEKEYRDLLKKELEQEPESGSSRVEVFKRADKFFWRLLRASRKMEVPELIIINLYSDSCHFSEASWWQWVLCKFKLIWGWFIEPIYVPLYFVPKYRSLIKRLDENPDNLNVLDFRFFPWGGVQLLSVMCKSKCIRKSWQGSKKPIILLNSKFFERSDEKTELSIPGRLRIILEVIDKFLMEELGAPPLREDVRSKLNPFSYLCCMGRVSEIGGKLIQPFAKTQKNALQRDIANLVEKTKELLASKEF